MALTSIFNNNPKWLGVILARDYGMDDSLIAELMAQGNEFTVASDQVIWEEEAYVKSLASVTGAGAVTKDGNDFTINPAAIPADAFDFDSDRPTEAVWTNVRQGVQFTAFSSTGGMTSGVVTSISNDGKTFTATPVGEDWEDLESEDPIENIEIYFTGNILAHCELAPCVASRPYNPKRENTMKKNSQCVEYCIETEIANGEDGGDAIVVFKNPNGDGEYHVSERLADKEKLLLEEMDYSFAFDHRFDLDVNTGLPKGTWGILPILENRAQKNQGMITTLQDAKNLAANMLKQNVKYGVLRCTTEQSMVLADLFPLGGQFTIDPFKDNTNALFHFGYGGFKIGEVTILFKRWKSIDNLGENVGKRYHYLMIPQGKLKRVINGKEMQVGYLNIAWFGNKKENWKFRTTTDEIHGGNFKTDIEVKAAPIVLRPQDFILGVSV
ncbi:MAG: hypothetical protein LBE36_13575 [Flavobacteriaceae bacterium]|nr:hypothetical protein [Flavobacteriaceae bacterium]